DAVRDIAEAAAATLEVDRVGIWLFTHDRQTLRCSDLYDRIAGMHTDGHELTAAQFPVYFRALEAERTISAHDARLDPRTSAFTESYLIPAGITSMLDAPIRRLGHVTGVICFEHTGAARVWSADEENFASSIADLVAMAFDALDRRHSQDALRHRAEFEKIIAAISTRFVSLEPDELDAAIEESLGALGRFVGAERAHVWLMSDDGLSAQMTHDWSAEGIGLTKAGIPELPAAAFPWWVDRLQHASRIVVSSLDDLPPEAINERRFLEKQ